VTLVTAAGAEPPIGSYAVAEAFYRRVPGRPGSRVRRLGRLARHGPDLVRYGRSARGVDVVHWQWLPVQALDALLLPGIRPRVLTAHDVLPREAAPLQRAGQRRLYARMDAVVVHSEHGARRLTGEAGVDPARVHVIPHGVLDHLARVPLGPLPAELGATEGPVVLCFGLIRPYKGVDVLVEAWRRLAPAAELWIVGRPRMDVAQLRARSPASVRWLTRWTAPGELAALFRRADLVVLPYREIDQSGVLFTALAFGRPLLLTAVGGFPEVARTGAAELVPPADPDALAAALGGLLAAPERRAALAAAARAAGAPDGPYGWDGIARRTLDLYALLRSQA